MKMNTQQSKTYKTQQGSPEKEVHSNAGLHKEDRKKSNKQPNTTYTKTRGITTSKAQNK